jgi:hypothetical protein
MCSYRRIGVFLAAMGILCLTGAYGADVTGSIAGIVNDQTGAVMPNVTVTATTRARARDIPRPATKSDITPLPTFQWVCTI